MAGTEVAEVFPKNILLDDIKVMWPNFAGEAGQYNVAGKRNFVAFLPPHVAEDFKRQGYNVKYLKPREEDAAAGEPPQAFIKVNVNFDSNNPPELWLVNSKGKRRIFEDSAVILDWATFRRADMVVTRYQRKWNDGRETVTLYLQTFYGFLQEDELRERYSEIPELDGGGNAEIEGSADMVLYQVADEDEIEAELVQAALER